MLLDNHKEECLSWGCEYNIRADGIEECNVKPVEPVHEF
jgi:hypothetical protein